MVVRPAGFRPRGHMRHQRTGISSEEPGREKSDRLELEADQAAGREGRVRLASHGALGLAWRSRGICLARGWNFRAGLGHKVQPGDLSVKCPEVRAEAKGVREQ